jgi:hypothetical protein
MRSYLVGQVFCIFDRIILAAIFVGIILLGYGMLRALEVGTVAVNQAQEISKKADRNFIATTQAAEAKRIADQARGNATIGIILPVLLDIDEDVEQLKKIHNISRGGTDDYWVIDFNGTSLSINNQTTVFVPNFRQLLGLENSTGNADILS